MKQVLGKKWLAYAKAHIEGDDYYFIDIPINT